MSHQDKVRVAIFASGSGSNARALIEFSQNTAASYRIVAIISNKESPGAKLIAEQFGVPFEYVSDSGNAEALTSVLQKHKAEVVALGGYMKLLPSDFVAGYIGKIINIHPSLLPDYGGKGMYGMHVHMAVFRDKKPFTGITIHFVDEEYDTGSAIVQARVDIAETDTPESIAVKVQETEHLVYPMVLDHLCQRIYSQS
jgi:phosphoribosylglycinamide formyltransferase-1